MSTATLETPVALPQVAPQASGRRTMLDVMRLIAAYAIVWLHSPQSPDFARATAIGRFAVPFFTAAAVFLTWEGLARQPRRSAGQYAKSRFQRIYVPFMAWSVIYLAFKASKAILLPNQPNDFPGVDVLWLGSFYHLWFMPFILVTTLTVFFLGRVVIGQGGRELASVPVCLILGWVIAWLPADRESLSVGFCQLAADALPAAFWGVGFAIAWQRGAANWLRRPSVGCAALAVAVLCLATDAWLLRNRLAENLAGVALLIFALADWRLPQLDRLARLGALAYGIYLSHLLFIKTLQAARAKLAIPETLMVVLGVFTIAAASSTLLAWCLSRSRWTRWLVG
jgi:peptidoglycan/LPS O-acetylase OafA/YrhL